MFGPKFEIRESTDGKEYFVLKAKNGKIVAMSEGYNSRQALMNGIKSVRYSSLFATITEKK